MFNQIEKKEESNRRLPAGLGTICKQHWIIFPIHGPLPLGLVNPFVGQPMRLKAFSFLLKIARFKYALPPLRVNLG